MSVAELAAAAGVTKPSIYRWISLGVVERGDDKLVPLQASLDAIAAARTGTAGPGRGKHGQLTTGGSAKPEAPPGGEARQPGDAPPKKKGSLVHWKTVGVREDALKKRLERLARQGELVARADVERDWVTLLASLGAHLDGIGRVLQDALAAETDPRKCGDMVEAAIRRARERLADAAPEGDEEDEDVDD